VRGIREAFIVQVTRVEEWWADGKTKYEAIRRIRERLRDLHPYFFAPSRESAAGSDAAVDSRPIRTRMLTEAPAEKEIPFD